MPLNVIEKMIVVLQSEAVTVWHFFGKPEGPRFCWQPLAPGVDVDNANWRWCESMEQMVEEAYAHVDPFAKPIHMPAKPTGLVHPPVDTSSFYVGVDLASGTDVTSRIGAVPDGLGGVELRPVTAEDFPPGPLREMFEAEVAGGRSSVVFRPLTAEDFLPGPVREKFEADTTKTAILRNPDPQPEVEPKGKQPGDDFVGGA